MAVLDVSSVTKRFGGLTAVNAASFSIDAKSIHGLIGPNGSGKSTLFNLITGILRPDAGRIAIDGFDVTGAPCHRIIRRGVARTFQNIELFYDMSVLENCMVGTFPVTRAGAIAAMLRPHWVAAEEVRIHELALESLAFVGLEGLAGELARNTDRHSKSNARALIKFSSTTPRASAPRCARRRGRAAWSLVIPSMR